MNKEELKNLIVYTGVYYQDNETYRTRSKIWFETFDNAQKLGIKVVVRNDGGLPEAMLERIKAYSNITIVEKTTPNTLGGGRREALQKAIEIADKENIANPIFLWTEPEKDNLITEETLLKMVSEIRNGTHIAVAEREEKAWNQLPRLQGWIERRANKRAQEVLANESSKPQENLDLWFAPKAFDKTGSKYFLDYNSEKNKLDLWDSLMVPVQEARKDGVQVKGVQVDFLYNKAQIENESDESNKEIQIKRLEQYAQILKELGDKKWIEFFEDSKVQLDEIKKINKENREDKNELLKEPKKALFKNFFR